MDDAIYYSHVLNMTSIDKPNIKLKSINVVFCSPLTVGAQSNSNDAEHEEHHCGNYAQLRTQCLAQNHAERSHSVSTVTAKNQTAKGKVLETNVNVMNVSNVVS